MFDVLAGAEQALPALLRSSEGWNSLDVTYEPPRVERLWRPFEFYSEAIQGMATYRLYLHRIHPCDRALYHPHPWPSIIKILAGGYEMGVGYGQGQDLLPPIAAKIKLAPGSTYSMTDKDGWHYVLPTVPNLSIMITGEPWDRWSPGPGPDVKLGPLSEVDATRLLGDFQAVYWDYTNLRAGLYRSVQAARHIDALRRIGLPVRADSLQFDGGSCRICRLEVSPGHQCWTEVDGKIVWLPDI